MFMLDTKTTRRSTPAWLDEKTFAARLRKAAATGKSWGILRVSVDEAGADAVRVALEIEQPDPTRVCARTDGTYTLLVDGGASDVTGLAGRIAQGTFFTAFAYGELRPPMVVTAGALAGPDCDVDDLLVAADEALALARSMAAQAGAPQRGVLVTGRKPPRGPIAQA